MQLALCEDSTLDEKQIRECLNAAGRTLDIDIDIDGYRSSEELLKKIKEGYHCDAYILDIFMGGMDGLTLAQKIQISDPAARIVFVTSTRDFAVEAFKIRALHYLVKPVSEADMVELLNRLIADEEKAEPVFTLNNGKVLIQFKQAEIVKIESYSHGINLYKRDRKEPYWFRMLFTDIEQQASEKCFAKASRGILINMKDVSKIEKQFCYLKDGSYITISRNQMKDFKKTYMNYLFLMID